MKLFSPSFLFLFFFCCNSFVFGQANRLPDDDIEDPQRLFHPRGGQVDWGLALSGGGIRSGAFSIGVMKALYQTDLWDDIDVISTVSGGGYGSYWVFRSYDKDSKLKFGEAVFNENLFVRNLCRLEKKSDFYSFGNMGFHLFRSRDSAFNSYEGSIRRTFSPGSREKVKIDYLNSEIAAARVPFFILNVSVGGKDKEGAFRNVFEIAPTYLGNEKFGYYNWTNDYDQISNYSESVATAGAGIRFKLSRRIPNQEPPPTQLDLADGGLLENTGALALIRRGVKNIIIVDAENDPGYKFGAYTKLRDWLCHRYQIKLRVKYIEDFLNSPKKARIFTTAAVAKGYARRAGEKPIDTTIYYIKMSRPAAIFSAINENSPMYKDGEAYIQKRDRILKNNGNLCDSLAGLSFNENMFAYRVENYSHFQNDEWILRGVAKILPYFNYRFPETATLDQTFSKKQFEAFVGLGYLQAKRVRDRLNDVIEPTLLCDVRSIPANDHTGSLY